MLIPMVERYVEEQGEARMEPYMGADVKFKLEVDANGHKHSYEDKIQIMNRFKHLPFRGQIRIKEAQTEFHILEDYVRATHDKPSQMRRCLFTRLVGTTSRHLVGEFELKRRGYIGTTSMSATLSFLVSNQALVKSNSLVIDPFVGTGSLLVSAARFGAHVMGSDIDFRVLRGKDMSAPKRRKTKEQWRRSEEKKEMKRDHLGKINIETNFDQYGLSVKAGLDLVRVDMNQIHVWRFANEKHYRGGVFDAIICDPPYGIRAGARRVGRSDAKPVPEQYQLDHIPATEVYDVQELMFDLLEFAAKALVMGGRLVYWYPTTPYFQESDLPTNKCLRLVSNCCDEMNSKQHRRLITVEKFMEYTFLSTSTVEE